LEKVLEKDFWHSRENFSWKEMVSRKRSDALGGAGFFGHNTFFIILAALSVLVPHGSPEKCLYTFGT
jgi:hypothetical protein